MSVFRAGSAQAKRAPLPEAEAQPAPSAPRTVQRTHSLTEIEPPVEARPLALRGPKGKFSLTVSGCGNEPEFNAFFYDDGKVAFYYYACPRAKAGSNGVLVHARSRARFASGVTPLSPNDEKRARANIEWLVKNRDFKSPQLKINKADKPAVVEFIW